MQHSKVNRQTLLADQHSLKQLKVLTLFSNKLFLSEHILFEKQRNLASLVTAIENSDLEGKSTVLDHIHMIYRRYILNLGE